MANMLTSFVQAIIFTGVTLISISGAGNGNYASMFHPATTSDSVKADSLTIIDQKIKVDLFPQYAVLYADYWINNPDEESKLIIVGYPEKDMTRYWFRVYVNKGGPFEPPVQEDDTAGINSSPMRKWQVNFLPGVTQVSISFGLSTLDSTGINSFRYHFNQIWNGKGKGEIWLRMNGGLTTSDIISLFPEKNFYAGNSLVHGFIQQLADSAGELIIQYRQPDSSGIILSRVQWELLSRKLGFWNPDEKTLATLQPFHLKSEVTPAERNENPEFISKKISWIIGIVVVIAILSASFFITRKRKPG